MADLPSITRRIFLKSTPAAVAVAGSISAQAEAGPSVSPLGRFKAAVEELKAAAEALDPNIYDWVVKTNGDMKCGLLIAAYRRTTKYDGDGWYETAVASDVDHGRVYVERASKYDKAGERWFRITSHVNGRRFVSVTPERHFATEYGKKISI